MATAQGTCAPQFQDVRTLFQENLQSGEELGASLSVNVDGVDVVDLWGGYANADRTRPWNEDTIVNVFSTTKCIAALAVLMLIDQGRVSANDKVTQYWPEFAANGKEDIEIRHLLSHTSGLAGWEEAITMDELCNPDHTEILAKLARQKPWWTPGTASGYHSWTFGLLLGEIVRRVTGLRLKDYVAQKMSGPLGADVQIGLAEKDYGRVGDLVGPPPLNYPAPEPGSIPAKTFLPITDAEVTLTEAWRKAEISSGNGHMNAQGLVRLFSQATLAGKGGDDEDKRLISPKTVDLIFTEQSRGPDLAIWVVIRMGMGFGLVGDGDTAVDEFLPEGRIAHWGGWGGSFLIMDFDRKMTIGYTMNKMANGGPGTPILRSYVKAIYKGLGVEVRGPK